MFGDRIPDEVQGWSDLARCAYQKIQPILGNHIAKAAVQTCCKKLKTDPYKLGKDNKEDFANYIADIARVYSQLEEHELKNSIIKCLK